MTSKPMIYNTSNYTPPFYYRFVVQLVKPLYRLKVWQRSHLKPTYKREIDERFGKQYPSRPDCTSVIWCHAVSLGETNTVAPLLDLLLNRGYGIWLTNTTQTGFDRGQQRFASVLKTGQLVQTFVPVDTKQVVQKFLDRVCPDAAIFVETELWPVILAELSHRNIPAILVNARLSAQSYANYKRFEFISRPMIQSLSLIIAQDSETAKRFRKFHIPSKKIRIAPSLKWATDSFSLSDSLSSSDSFSSSASTSSKTSLLADTLIKVEECSAHESNESNESNEKLDTTNLKFAEDSAPFGALLTNLAGGANIKRPIWVAASTHEGEESIIIEVHKRLVSAGLANTLLILVPRHPERFNKVAELLQVAKLPFSRRSQQQLIESHTHVYLADTMGELMHWYAMADIAFVGGSLIDVGGHNPIEAASVATPIIMGPYTKTCQTLVDALRNIEALKQIGVSENAIEKDLDYALKAELYAALRLWLQQPNLAKKAGLRAQDLVKKNKDAACIQLQMLAPLLPKISSMSISNSSKKPLHSESCNIIDSDSSHLVNSAENITLSNRGACQPASLTGKAL